MAEQIDMDAVLDEALDEIDDDDDGDNDVPVEAEGKEHVKPSRFDTEREHPSKAKEVEDAEQANDDSESEREADANVDDAHSPADVFQNMLREFIQAEEDGGDPDERVGQFMNQVQSQLLPTEKKESSKDTTAPENDVDKTIAAILEEMAKANIGESSDISEEDILKGVFQGFQDAGEDFNPDSFNPDAVIDGMMEQLLSKDLMYEPMKQVTEKFPKWLEENKSKLSPEDYQQ
jgi:peroxin-19